MSTQASILDSIQLDPNDATGYSYVGTHVGGRIITGYVNCADRQTALHILERGCISVDPISLRRRKEPPGARRRITRYELGLFATQLADRLKAGEPWASAMRNQARSTSNRALKTACSAVADVLQEAGATAENAFRTQAQVFPETFCHVVHLGESTGDPTGLLRDYGEAQISTGQMLSKLKGALIYPGAVLSVGLLVGALLVYFVIPRLQEVYQSLLEVSHGQLPFLTRALLAVAAFLTSVPGIALMLGLVALAVSGYRWATGPGRPTVQRYALDIPFVGPLIRDFHASFTARSIGLLVDATDLTDAINQTAKSSIHVLFREMLDDCRTSIIEQGRSLGEATAPFPHLMGDEFAGIVSAGETSGMLQNQLLRYSQTLEQRMKQRIESASHAIEPLMILLVAAIIAPIVLAAYLPLFTLIGQLASSH